MSHPVARRYAQALYEEAVHQDDVTAVDADVMFIRESLEGSDELARFFESPILSAEQKRPVIEALFKERVVPLTCRFLQLLVKKQREMLLVEVLVAYRALRDAQEGVVEVRARTAHPLGHTGRDELTQRLEAMTGKEVRLLTEQDPTLLGGLVVRIGDTVYDGSVRHQLASLHERMLHGGEAANGRE